MRMSLLMAITAVLAAPAALGAAPDPAELDRMTQGDVALLAFLDGAPLSREEQGAVRTYLERASAADPARIAAGAARVREAVTLLERHDPRGDAAVRETYRPAIEALPADDAERRIADAHDPTVAFDPAAKLIVTEHTIDAIAAAMRWSAGAVGKPPGDGTAKAAIRAALGREFAGMDHANKEAYAHVESNAAAALPALSRAPAAEQRAAVLKWGDADEPLHLMRDTVSSLAFTRARLAAAAGGKPGDASDRLMRSMTDRQMQQSIWTMGHPECGPLGGNPGSCSQAPIYRAITP